MNVSQLTSLIIILTLELPFSYTASNNTQPLPPNGTSPATVTWVRITTLDPKSRDERCKNCASFDYDDVDGRPDSSSRRRRKRRRNKKPSSDRQRSSHHSRKKYSTRVHLDKPAKFAADKIVSTTASHPALPPPVRYLLPPFATSDFIPGATGEWTAGRGSTKFKDTVHERENELDSFYSSTPSPPSQLTTPARTAKTRLRPIVVPPVFYANSTEHPINLSSLEFASPEVAGTKAQQPTPAYMQHLIQSPPPHESRVTQNEPRGFEHTTRMPTARWLATESFQPVDISENNILDPYPLQELNHESRPTSAFHNNLVYQPERFGEIREFPSSTTAFRNENSRQSSRFSENYSSTSATRRTPVTVAYNVTSYSPMTNNGGDDGFNGLQLAESSYFSDLPSQGEVMKLTQTDVIPGVAGKDYPIYSQSALLRKRKFACRGLEGYFADISTRCQVFYICNGNGAGEPMLCPNGTLFSQELLVCDWWYNVDC